MKTLSYLEINQVVSGGNSLTSHASAILQSTFMGTLSGLGTAVVTSPDNWKKPILAGLVSGAFSGIGAPIYQITSQKINDLMQES